MEATDPSPQTTLLILLGASHWPLFPEFQDSEAFANAARELKAYFLDPKRFGLSPENVLDVFNSNRSPDEQDAQIGRFLERRLAALKAAGHTARDLLVYFVGHGGFVGRDSDFYLAIRRTREENPRASGIPMVSLADTLMEKARYLRRIFILDCCFAAAAFSAFQTGPAQVAIEKAVDAFEVRQRRVGFPAKGTALLCSSSQKSPSLLLPDGSSTMFTKAFLDALAEGLPSQGERLSLREVKDLAANLLSETRNAPRPVVLSPDQSEGDVADIPFFPNPRAEEERARRAEEERERKAREEQALQVREERRLPAPNHRRRNLFIALIACVLLLLVGRLAFSVLPLLSSKNTNTPNQLSNIVGRIVFVSSPNAPHNTFDQLQITLNNILPPAAGKTYYAWVENSNNEAQTPHWPLQVSNGSVHYVYPGDANHTDLLTNGIKFLITEEDSGSTPIIPSPDLSTHLYYAILSKTSLSPPTFDVKQCPASSTSNATNPCA